MAVWRLQVNTGGANVADCLQNHVAALWAGKVLAYLMGNYYDSKATYEMRDRAYGNNLYVVNAP